MKKVLSVLISIMMFLGMGTAYAYNFPTPDWGALLQQKTNMVMQKDFGLYVEGDKGNAPYFGAKFEPRSGAYIGMAANENIEEFKPLGSYLTYIQDFHQYDLFYPSNAMIRQDDVISMIGWTVTNLNNVDYDRIDSVLETLNAYNKPMFIRFGNEMNCSELGDDPDLYVSVFRNVANLIHKYDNLAVVWSPNDIGALDRPFEYFYPGDEYVDWIGVSCYMKKYFNNNPNTAYKDSIYFMTGDFGWATNKIKPIVEFMQKHKINKPLMLSEGGVATSNTFGDSAESNEEWNIPRMRNLYWNLIMKYPQIKMINYFNVYRAYETEKYDISGYGYASDIFKEAAASGAYIRSLNGGPDFVYTPAENGDTLAAKDGIVNLYTLAYMPQNPNIYVTYKIDGTWIHTASQIPYKCNFDINSITDGAHTLTIEAAGMSKSYKLYKNGQYMRFGHEPDLSNISNYEPEPEYVPDYFVLSNMRTFVNGEEMPTFSHSKLGGAYIIVEDLKDYGFDIDWDGYTKTVSVIKNNDKELTPLPMEYYRSYGAGYKFFAIEEDSPVRVLFKNNAYDAGYSPFAYSCSGYMALSIDELKAFTEDWVWDGNELSLSLNMR